MIDGGMRSGIPVGRHEFVMTRYGNGAAYREALGMDDRSLADLFIPDRDGYIGWEGRGFADSAGVSALLQTAEHLLSQ